MRLVFDGGQCWTLINPVHGTAFDAFDGAALAGTQTLPARRLSLELRRLKGADAIQPSSPAVAAWSELQLVSS